ncbi:MAG: magnesium transporter [Thermosediminibacterales bacterium]|nr:magnesium transporter [Thermosediminibacterales bacterium]
MNLDKATEMIKNMEKNEIKKLLEEQHPADTAEIIENLPEEKKIFVFKLLNPQKAVEVLEEFDYDNRLFILSNINSDYAGYLLKEMSHDELVDFLSEIPLSLVKKWIQNLDEEDRENIKTLLTYPETSAGGIMTTEVVSFLNTNTVEEVMKQLPDMAPDAETIYYIYVVDKRNRLIGVVSLRDLILADPDSKLEEIMLKDVKKVTVDTDQEEVARMIDKYGFLGIPVVDEKDHLLGIVTVDDIMEVLKDEATEDILKLSGTVEDIDIEKKGPFNRALRRLPWLLVALFGEIISGGVIDGFSHTLEAVVALSFFIPVLMDMGGNVGTQSSAIIVRGIATGNINPYEIGKNLFRETVVGLLVGVFCGIVVAGVAVAWQKMPVLGLVVGTAMSITLTAAAIIGTLIPLLLNRLGQDPAVASGPFITTALDISGLFIYFGSATIFMGRFF